MLATTGALDRLGAVADAESVSAGASPGRQPIHGGERPCGSYHDPWSRRCRRAGAGTGACRVGDRLRARPGRNRFGDAGLQLLHFDAVSGRNNSITVSPDLTDANALFLAGLTQPRRTGDGLHTS